MEQRNDRVLGVLGGMGPLASAHFMARLTLLTPAERDQDHIPAVLWSDPRVPDRTRAKLAGGEDPTRFSADQHSSTRGMGATHAPQGGILPEVHATGFESSSVPHMEDRGVYHAADAMKSLYDMGDAPSCHTCGAIMVRNGSCYRCMSCGSTSGCS